MAKEEGYIFHGEIKTETSSYKHLKGNDTYCQSQCDIFFNGLSINTFNLDCFISAYDVPREVLSCFIRHFASKNPLSSYVVCSLNFTLNHATTLTQQTILAEIILTCHDVTPHYEKHSGIPLNSLLL